MILLAYRDRNVHELLCHEVALRAGYYDQFGVEVGAVPASEHPEAPLSAGLGGSLVESVRGRRRWRAVLVHTVHPLFWIWQREADPAPAVLAGHPEGSIVLAFTERLLNGRGTAPSILHFPAGDDGDADRLEALRSGAVDAAVLGSNFAPSTLSRLGLTESLFFGDALRFPTAGVAVDLDLISVDDPSVRAVVAAQRAALRKVRARDPLAVEAVASFLHRRDEHDAPRLLEDYLAPQYGPDLTDVRAAGAEALAWLTEELRPAGAVAAGFYEEVR
ncbi:hypothetical protein [Actinomadura sp. DC4]|uniref:hypothetical protein n=1 Tax=Actinomadura sp. DC4 TaxID=3055069 RepID=UPI0025B06049|nr:hypothetical protein [Actinomadura sp. DC4]MDN3358173.1 hypothetical protein [Actinomadura sp. DC4]